MESIQKLLFLTKSEKKLPVLPRDYFVHLWKNLHDLIEFGNLTDTTMEGRQEMYHSISLVGTLLLQIGEVGQRVKDTIARSKSIDEQIGKNPNSLPTSISSYQLNSGEWSVTFEQFLASFMNESCLVDYFDKQIDLVAKLKQFSDRKLNRQETGAKTVYYA